MARQPPSHYLRLCLKLCQSTLLLKYILLPDLKKNFKRLPKEIQKKAVAKDQLFRSNSFDLSLDTHKLTGELKDYWSYSVDYHYRVLFRFNADKEAIYFNIGTHNIYRQI